jgi:hypothetical protein
VLLPAWSPDSAHLAYIGGVGNTWWVLVDDQQAKTLFPSFIGGSSLIFDDPKHVRGLAMRFPGPEFVRYNLTLP